MPKTSHIVLKYSLVLFLALFSAFSWGQSKYNLVGVVSNTDMARREPGVTISVTSGGAPVTNIATSNSGKFNLSFAYGKKYKVEFSKPGLASRFLYVDLTGINVEDVPAGDLTQEMDMSLFGEIPGVDLTFLKTMPTTTFTLNMKKMMSDFDHKQADDMKAKIDAILAKKEAAKAANEEKLRQYEQLMSSGDQNFAATKYEDALKNYQAALAILPTEALPKEKIEATNAKIKELAAQKGAAEKEAQYNALIQEADKAFVAKDWKTAESKYEAALALKPNEPHPTQRILEIDEILTNIKKAELEAQKKEEQYKNLITAADNLRNQKQYENAKAKYNEAIAIKNEQYPKDQIVAIDKMIQDAAEQAKKDAAYDAAMKAAAAAYGQNKLEDALAKYKEATAIKPQEPEPKAKITEITQKIADAAAQAQKDKVYQDAITAADGLFAQQKFTEAKAKYTQASGVKPEEAYPKSQITLIDQKIQELEAKKSLDKSYADKITQADGFFNTGAYDQAKAAYIEAQKIKPAESYPAQKIAEIDKKIAELAAAKEKEGKYTQLINDATNLLASNKLEEAKSKFVEASGLKPEEQLPKTKIAEIDKKIAEIAAAKELETKYNAAITQGQTYLTSGDLKNAKQQFETALALKPSEALPKSKLEEINAKIAEQEKQALIDKQYKELVAAADNLFNTTKYADAKAKYLEAKQVKQDPYLDERIKTIDAKMAEIAKKEAQAKAYNDKIVLADNALGRGELDNAKKAYEEALAIDPTQAYPKTKITEIAAKMAAQQSAAEREAKFNELVSQADQLANDQKLEQAVAKYGEALAVKADQGVQQKMAALQNQINLLKGQAQKDADYQAAISDAQGKENAGDLQSAIAAYQKAQSIKPSETLPAQKITELQNKLSTQQQQAGIDAQFNQAIKDGDALFANGAYSEAKAKYQLAGSLKSDPIVPQKIAMVDQKMKDESTAQVEANYQKIIKKANEYRDAKDWENAIKYYERALTFKPEDQVPQDEIAKIKAIQQQELAAQANQADVEKRYNDAMTLGNQKMASMALEDALAAFLNAQNIKPGDAPAAQKIKEVNDLIAKKMGSEQTQAKYLALIQEGDKKAAAFDYENAISSYEQALVVKPNDSEATRKIAEAKAQIEQRAQADVNMKYAKWIEQATQAFNQKQYEIAKNFYTEALKTKPGDKLATDKIAEIQQILDNIAAQSNQDKAKLEEYQKIIHEADSKFVNESWKDAQHLYEKALTVIPKDKYATDQLNATIAKQELETNSMMESQYKKILAKGDEYFGKEKWDDAIRMYERAISLKSDDPYPKDKIAEIARIKRGDDKQRIKLDDLGKQEDITVMDGEALIQKAEIIRKAKKNEKILNRAKTSDEEVERLSKRSRNRNLRNTELVDSIVRSKELTDVELLGLQNDLIKKVDSIQTQKYENDRLNSNYEYNSAVQTSNYVNEVSKDKEVLGALGQENPKKTGKEVENITFKNEENTRVSSTNDHLNVLSTNEHMNNVLLEKEKTDTKSSAIRDGVQAEVEDIQAKEAKKNTQDLEKEYKEVKATNAKIVEVQTAKDQTAEEKANQLQAMNQKVADLNKELSDHATTQTQNAYTNNVNVQNKIVEVNSNSEEVNMEKAKDRQKIADEVDKIEDNQADLHTTQGTNEQNTVQETAEKIGIVEKKQGEINTDQQQKHEQIVSKVDEITKSQDQHDREANEDEKSDLLQTRQNVTNVEIAHEKEAETKGEDRKETAKAVETITKNTEDVTANKGAYDNEERTKLLQKLDDLEAKGVKFSEDIANTLADQFPAGVTEQNFPLYDSEGLLLSMKTRRIVVKNGRGDVYVRSTGRTGTTYTKNGNSIVDAIWEKETQDATLVKH